MFWQRDEAQAGEDRKTRVWSWALGFVVGVGLIITAYAIGLSQQSGGGGQQAVAASSAKKVPKQAAAGPGKSLFVSKCGSCHTLKAAGTNGQVGPNLSQESDASRILAAIKHGAGSGVMPAGIVSGKQARDIAKFVSSSAGQ